MTKLQKMWMYVLTGAWIITFASLVPPTHAQNPLATDEYWTAPAALAYSTSACPTPSTGYVGVCITPAGPYFITSAGVATNLMPSGGAAGVLNIDGVVPGSTGTITLTCAGAFPATEAAFAAGDNTTATVPALSVPVTCTAKGS